VGGDGDSARDPQADGCPRKSGPIHEAVRASIALVGILSSARIDGRRLVDGGLSNPVPVPVSVCRAPRADVIIAVNLNGDPPERRFTEPKPNAGVAPPRARKPAYANHPCPDALVKSSPTTRSLKSRSPPPLVSSQPQVFSP
jgi:predicted acylesterase/phospholipase RssA